MDTEGRGPQTGDGATANPEPRQPTRRQWLKGLTTGTVAIGAVSQSGCGLAVPPPKTLGATDTTTVCPFCGVGCGQVVSTRGGRVINIEGDPGHPVSEGTLCSKGAAAIQVVNNPRRLQKVLYRAPGGTAWEEKSWDWALERIAARVKETRDKTFQTSTDGRVVNRTEAIACLGGSALDNEEAYLLVKLMRAVDLTSYLGRVTPVATSRASANWLQNTPKYVVSLLKAWWGEHATRENDFAFAYLPKLGRGFQGQGYAFLALTHAMLAGELKGLFCFGQNPAVAAPTRG